MYEDIYVIIHFLVCCLSVKNWIIINIQRKISLSNISVPNNISLHLRFYPGSDGSTGINTWDEVQYVDDNLNYLCKLINTIKR